MPSPSFAIVQPYEELDPPVWHVDLYRIEDPSETGRARPGLGGRRGPAGRMAGTGGRRSVARSAPPVARLRANGDRALDSRGTPGMGRAMASTMIPPPHAHDFLAACGWQGAEILPLAGDASFRRYFRVVHGEPHRGADGCPAAARGPAAVRRGRRMARLGRPQRARDPRPRPRQGPAAARPTSATARLRESLDDDPARERELYELATDVLIHLHRHPPMPGLPVARARPVARGADAVHRLVLPGGRPRGRCRRLPRGVDGGARTGRRATGSARSRCFATITPRTSCWSADARASRISACSISRTRVAGHPAYDLASVLEDARRDVPPDDRARR